MSKKKHRSTDADRLTITLRQGQRRLLQEFADRNHVSVAFVIRYALDRFVEEYANKQLPFDFGATGGPTA
jgi:hypothetical protein